MKTAFVTGSARRLGLHIATRLVEAGWQVIVHSRNADDVRASCESIGAAGWVVGDLMKPEDCSRIVEEAMVQLGGEPLGLLVNSAGTFVKAYPSTVTLEQWDEAFLVNSRAALLVTQAALPHLDVTHGVVCNIHDQAADKHWTHFSVHAASKAALAAMTTMLADELGPGIRVVGISPNTVLPPDDMPKEKVEALAKQPGEVGTPDDVTDALFELLADPDSGGRVITIN